MAELPVLLVASLKPETRKQAEQNLNSISQQPGFLAALLQLVLNGSQEGPARLAASIYLKNIAKTRWDEVSFGCAQSSLSSTRVGSESSHGTRQGSTTESASARHACFVQPNR
jgi:hypothetical protein